MLLTATKTFSAPDHHIPEPTEINHSRPAAPDITFPGPDTSCFPMTPYTVQKGHAYYENYPIAISFRGNGMPFEYNWPFLLRIGLTDNFELRFMGQGITKIAPLGMQGGITGFSPLIIGGKANIWDSLTVMWLPGGGGIEIFVITPIASEKLDMGEALFVNALFKHYFPRHFSLTWNAGVGLSHGEASKNADNAYTMISWAFSKHFSRKFHVCFQGMYTSEQPPMSPKTLFLGIAAESALTKQFCIYGNFNWSYFHNTNPYTLNIGFAVAF